ncbi:MAG: hypothetical protein U5K29_07955 [Acidimicrobiales bacterium]|nr:hypothetical protein [Acidimicrobiales bacterium]
MPGGDHVHLFVAMGSAALDGREMSRGAAARLTAAGPVELTGGPDGAETLIWVTA